MLPFKSSARAAKAARKYYNANVAKNQYLSENPLKATVYGEKTERKFQSVKSILSIYRKSQTARSRSHGKALMKVVKSAIEDNKLTETSKKQETGKKKLVKIFIEMRDKIIYNIKY